MVMILVTILSIILSLDKVILYVFGTFVQTTTNKIYCSAAIMMCSFYAICGMEIPIFPPIDMTNEWITSVAARAEHIIETKNNKRKPLEHRKHRRYSNKWIRAYAVAILACSTETRARCVQEGGPYDTDSNEVGVDNRASGCISDHRSDYTGVLM